MCILRLFVLFSVLLLLATPASARPGQKAGHGIMNPKRIDRMATKLGVEDTVKTQMIELVAKAKRKSIDLKRDVKKNRKILHSLMDSEIPDRSAIMAQLDTVSGLQLDIRKLRVGTMLDIQSLLTPDQKVAMKTFLKRRAKKRGRRGPRGKKGQRQRGLKRAEDNAIQDDISP